MKLKTFLDKAFKIGSAVSFVAGAVLLATPAAPVGGAMVLAGSVGLTGRQLYKGTRNLFDDDKAWHKLTGGQKVSRVAKVIGTVFSTPILAGMALGEETFRLIDKISGKSKSSTPSKPVDSSPTPSTTKYEPPPIPPSSQIQKNNYIGQPPQGNSGPINIETMDPGSREKLAEKMLYVHSRDNTHTYLCKVNSNNKQYKLENGKIDTACKMGDHVQLYNFPNLVRVKHPSPEFQERFNANRNTRSSTHSL